MQVDCLEALSVDGMSGVAVGKSAAMMGGERGVSSWVPPVEAPKSPNVNFYLHFRTTV